MALNTVQLATVDVEGHVGAGVGQRGIGRQGNEDLVADIKKTQDTIARHQKNLIKFQDDEKQMVARFEGDITRFKDLKGLK